MTDNGSEGKKAIRREAYTVAFLIITVASLLVISACGKLDYEDVSGYYDGHDVKYELDVIDAEEIPAPFTSSTLWHSEGNGSNLATSVDDLGGAVCDSFSVSGDMSLELNEDGSFSFIFFDDAPIEGTYYIDDKNVVFTTDDGETETANVYKSLLLFNYVDGKTVQYVFQKN